ncbi:MAG: T9SS type A sorting domain-containing protein [Caldithrix sp.]|nr:T9SS type A sorting domain-containing protein [Caldithrix sp.]
MQYEIAIRSEINKSFSYKPQWKFEAFNKVRSNSIKRLTESPLQWVERGPGNIGGRSRAIVVHPQNADIWWVGAVGGGIWKTDNRGQSWQYQSQDMPVISVTTIDICREKPDILYAGTGEGFYNYDAIIGDGVFKTTDGGENWLQLNATANNQNFRYINRIIVHPQRADTLLVATNRGLFRSLDGGAKWDTVFSNPYRVQQIIANPLNFNSQYIAVNGDGIYKSTDMGATWQDVSTEITNHYRIELAISQADTNVLYAAAVNVSGGLKGLYRSLDAGQEWQYLGNEPNWFRTQGWYDNTLIVHPYDPLTVYAGGIDLYRIETDDNSMNPQPISHWYGANGLQYVHADQHFLVTIPDGDGNFAVVAANDGGIYYSPDQGVNWENRNNNYNVTQYYDADRHPFTNRFIAGSQDNGTNLSPNAAVFDSKWQEVVGGDGFDCAWHKTDPDIIYATLYNSNIYKSVDGGVSFQLLENGPPDSDIFHTPLLMSPYNSDKILTASGADRIYVTENGGQSWQSVSVSLSGSRYMRMAFSKADSNIVWVASNEDHINLSVNGGLSFNTIPKPTGSPNALLTGIATSPHNPLTVFALFGVSGFGKIYRSDDLGSSWQDISANLPNVPVHTLIVMPHDSSEIWIGTDIGLFISNDKGQTWAFANNNLPAVSIRRLKVVGQEVVAATHGRGVWSVHYPELPEPDVPLREPILAAIDPPNPNTNELPIRFTARGLYDSMQVSINNDVVRTLFEFPIYRDSSIAHSVNPPQELTVILKGYKDGNTLLSEEQSIRIYASVDSVYETFNSNRTAFYGDFSVATPTGFENAALHSPHPYDNKQEYLALLGSPVRIKKDSKLIYKDVAIIESGETGSQYPDFQMWDYVAVEGSRDGQNWQVLSQPYDCRLDSLWTFAYDNNVPGDASMFVEHQIDLTNFFNEGELILLRFRLFADDYTTGWGWALDDVAVNQYNITEIEPLHGIASQFRLYANFPNPFNPSTTIRFSLAENGPVTLKIYNSLGQVVRTVYDAKPLKAGTAHQVVWDGVNEQGVPVSSGLYFYQLKSKNQRAVKRMLLLK